MTMRFCLPGRKRQEALLIRTHHFPEATVQLHQGERGQLRWSCSCPAFQQEHPLREELWCEHIMRAAALRSIERLIRRRA
jgi:hypothetical protein